MGEAIEASNIEIENNFTLETFKKDVIEVLSNYLWRYAVELEN
jgi:hypothetical protein